MRVAIIGAGAAGLMCGGFIANKGHEVFIFDGNEKSGKKLYITGKGRCNFTNATIGDEFSNNIVRGTKFLYSALSKWNSFDTIEFFESLGVKTKIERGNRAFPVSDKASDITKALMKHCKSVNFCFCEKIIAIDKKDTFALITEKRKLYFDAVIIATGGASYDATGSTGDGYKFATRFGHNVIEIKPALVPIELSDNFIKELQGLSLKNVSLNCKADGKKISLFGELLFTDKGISGPIALSLSSQINRAKDISLEIDFKPALNEQQLEARILRDFSCEKNKNISSVVRGLLPSSLVKIFLSQCNISLEKKVNSITESERRQIILKLKHFSLSFARLYPVKCGIITSGGVDTKEINPKNMESKFIPNLFFIGEVLDIDALTGGFNLQLAFSTAVACAESF